jgi:hypothetical protein
VLLRLPSAKATAVSLTALLILTQNEVITSTHLCGLIAPSCPLCIVFSLGGTQPCHLQGPPPTLLQPICGMHLSASTTRQVLFSVDLHG